MSNFIKLAKKIIIISEGEWSGGYKPTRYHTKGLIPQEQTEGPKKEFPIDIGKRPEDMHDSFVKYLQSLIATKSKLPMYINLMDSAVQTFMDPSYKRTPMSELAKLGKESNILMNPLNAEDIDMISDLHKKLVKEIVDYLKNPDMQKFYGARKCQEWIMELEGTLKSGYHPFMGKFQLLVSFIERGQKKGAMTHPVSLAIGFFNYLTNIINRVATAWQASRHEQSINPNDVSIDPSPTQTTKPGELPTQSNRPGTLQKSPKGYSGTPSST